MIFTDSQAVVSGSSLRWLIVSMPGQSHLWHLGTCLYCQKDCLPLCCWVIVLYLVSTGVYTYFTFVSLYVETCGLYGHCKSVAGPHCLKRPLSSGCWLCPAKPLW